MCAHNTDVKQIQHPEKKEWKKRKECWNQTPKMKPDYTEVTEQLGKNRSAMNPEKTVSDPWGSSSSFLFLDDLFHFCFFMLSTGSTNLLCTCINPTGGKKNNIFKIYLFKYTFLQNITEKQCNNTSKQSFSSFITFMSLKIYH